MIKASGFFTARKMFLESIFILYRLKELNMTYPEHASFYNSHTLFERKRALFKNLSIKNKQKKIYFCLNVTPGIFKYIYSRKNSQLFF